MSDHHHNCYKCGTELTSGNTFSCKGCGRDDLCILHKGPASGLCAVCLDKQRKRLIYPTFSVIAFLMLVFAPYVLQTISPVLVFILILLLPLWLLIESLRPVTTVKRLRKVAINTSALAVVMTVAIIILWDFTLMEKSFRLTSGVVPSIFLFVGIILILLGFVFILAMSLSGLGVRIFNYEYPEETSILLKNAGKDPEALAAVKWDLRWLTWVNFIYGFTFVYMYLITSAR